MRIFKYALSPEGGDVMLPVGARILAVRDQANQVCLWAEVVPGAPLMTRRFRVIPTGGDVPVDGTYIGTFFPVDGVFVFHVYELNSR